jgi:hypothetical protein
MTNSVGYGGSDGVAVILKANFSSKIVAEAFVDKSNCYNIIALLGRIQEEGDAFLVTIDPFDSYQIESMAFSRVVNIVCSMLSRPLDIRVFGKSWAVGMSSYASSSQHEGSDSLSIDLLEMKISLVGDAIDWLPMQ